MIELEAFANARNLLRRGLNPEPFVDAVVDDGNLLRRHVEEVEDVALRRFRDGENAIGLSGRAPHRAAGVRVGGAIGQILRKHEVNASVNRHHGARTHGNGQHVMRRVKNVRLFTHKHERDVELLRNGVISGRLQHGPEVFAEGARDPHVGLVAEQDVLVFPIDPREMPQEVADVGADPEIVEFSGIDRNFHWWLILRDPATRDPRSDIVGIWDLGLGICYRSQPDQSMRYFWRICRMVPGYTPSRRADSAAVSSVVLIWLAALLRSSIQAKQS